MGPDELTLWHRAAEKTQELAWIVNEILLLLDRYPGGEASPSDVWWERVIDDSRSLADSIPDVETSLFRDLPGYLAPVYPTHVPHGTQSNPNVNLSWWLFYFANDLALLMSRHPGPEHVERTLRWIRALWPLGDNSTLRALNLATWAEIQVKLDSEIRGHDRYLRQLLSAPELDYDHATVVAQSDGTRRIAPLDPLENSGLARLGSDLDRFHSEDFTTLVWRGETFHFSKAQSRVIARLWQAWINGTPSVSTSMLLEVAGSSGTRLRDVFKGHPAWGTVIVKDGARGSVQMPDPRGE